MLTRPLIVAIFTSDCSPCTSTPALAVLAENLTLAGTPTTKSILGSFSSATALLRSAPRTQSYRSDAPESRGWIAQMVTPVSCSSTLMSTRCGSLRWTRETASTCTKPSPLATARTDPFTPRISTMLPRSTTPLQWKLLTWVAPGAAAPTVAVSSVRISNGSLMVFHLLNRSQAARMVHAICTASIRTKCHECFDLGRPPCRQINGQCRHHAEQSHDRDISDSVARPDLEQHGCQESCRCSRDEQSHEQPYRDELGPSPQHHPHDVPCCCA